MNLEVDLEAREDVPAWLTYGTPVFTVLAALAVSSVALVALGVDPVGAYALMFIDTATTTFGLSETLVKAIPLILTGLAVYLPLRGGLWNIGAEGQLYVGAIAGTWLAVNVDAGVAIIPLVLVGAGAAGGVWGAIPGYLRAKLGVNEIIVTLMMTFIGIRLASYLVRGPMRGGEGNFPVSAVLPEAAQFQEAWGSLHWGFVVVVLMTLVVLWLIRRSSLGYEITFVGSNPDAARQAGMSTFWVYVFVLAAGGLLAGLAGTIEIMGVQDRLRPDFSPGYGFTAIPIALLGRNGAWQVFLAGLFFALLFVGGSSMEIEYNVPAALVEIIQALIILFLITAEFFKRYEVDVRLRRSGAAAGTAVEEGA